MLEKCSHLDQSCQKIQIPLPKWFLHISHFSVNFSNRKTLLENIWCVTKINFCNACTAVLCPFSVFFPHKLITSHSVGERKKFCYNNRKGSHFHFKIPNVRVIFFCIHIRSAAICKLGKNDSWQNKLCKFDNIILF